MDTLSSASEEAMKRVKKSAIFTSWILLDCSVECRGFKNSTLLHVSMFRIETPSLE